ncbi:MAG: hypothetical protein ACR2GQ_05015 [Gemmatimonadota bacterium]
MTENFDRLGWSKAVMDASLIDAMVALGVAHSVVRSRLTLFRDRPERARQEAHEMSDSELKDLAGAFGDPSWRGVAGGEEFFSAMSVEIVTRGL